ncbi:MAG: hypothetical protein ACKVS6_01455 [Planctomycetota bacterium]
MKPTKQKRLRGPDGRIWTITKVKWTDAAKTDARFWYEKLTPAERVEAVYDALVNCYKTRGQRVPRLRRIHRRVKRA